MNKDCNRGVFRSRWFLPSFSLALGLVMLAVSWLGGNLGEGVISLAVMAGFGLFVLFAGRSETIRGLRGKRVAGLTRDSERVHEPCDRLRCVPFGEGSIPELGVAKPGAPLVTCLLA